MKKKKKKQQPLISYIKAARKGSREAEIELYGHLLNHHKIVKSKKVYDRKKSKADDKDLPYFFGQRQRAAAISFWNQPEARFNGIG